MFIYGLVFALTVQGIRSQGTDSFGLFSNTLGDTKLDNTFGIGADQNLGANTFNQNPPSTNNFNTAQNSFLGGSQNSQPAQPMLFGTGQSQGASQNSLNSLPNNQQTQFGNAQNNQLNSAQNNPFNTAQNTQFNAASTNQLNTAQNNQFNSAQNTQFGQNSPFNTGTQTNPANGLQSNSLNGAQTNQFGSTQTQPQFVNSNNQFPTNNQANTFVSPDQNFMTAGGQQPAWNQGRMPRQNPRGNFGGGNMANPNDIMSFGTSVNDMNTFGNFNNMPANMPQANMQGNDMGMGRFHGPQFGPQPFGPQQFGPQQFGPSGFGPPPMFGGPMMGGPMGRPFMGPMAGPPMMPPPRRSGGIFSSFLNMFGK